MGKLFLIVDCQAVNGNKVMKIENHHMTPLW